MPYARRTGNHIYTNLACLSGCSTPTSNPTHFPSIALCAVIFPLAELAISVRISPIRGGHGNISSSVVAFFGGGGSGGGFYNRPSGTRIEVLHDSRTILVSSADLPRIHPKIKNTGITLPQSRVQSTRQRQPKAPVVPL